MTKTAEQVVAEALGIHVDHPDMWDLEARDVVAALRDAGMLREPSGASGVDAIENVIQKFFDPFMESNGTHVWVEMQTGAGIVQAIANAVITHLDADEPAETDWEYGCDLGLGGEPRAHPSRESAETDAGGTTITRFADGSLSEFPRRVVRRRRAGEWEEIPNE